VPGIPGREPFPLEHVAEVAPAAGTLNLGAIAIGVGDAAHGPGDLLVESGPAAMGVELVLGTVESRTALFALIRSSSSEVLVLAGERRLGALVQNHASLRPGERTERWVGSLGHGPSIGGTY